MRIISGKYKGRRIRLASEKTTRPTTDMVREAWASTLVTLVPGGSFDGLRVLDAFAGSGALGLELLSRGAEHCLFLENDKRAFGVLRENIAALELSEQAASAALLDSLSPKLPAFFKTLGSFDLVVLDPPYSLSLKRVQGLLANLAKAGLLREQTTISYEHAEAQKSGMDGLVLPKTPHPLIVRLVKSKKYGTINLDYYICTRAEKEEL